MNNAYYVFDTDLRFDQVSVGAECFAALALLLC
jgi:hypothetical protein